MNKSVLLFISYFMAAVIFSASGLLMIMLSPTAYQIEYGTLNLNVLQFTPLIGFTFALAFFLLGLAALEYRKIR